MHDPKKFFAFLLLVIGLFDCNTANSQKLTLKDDKYYQIYERIPIHTEEFSNNTNEWIDSNDTYASIHDGFFHLKPYPQSVRSSWGSRLKWNYNTDFELEIFVKIIDPTIWKGLVIRFGNECEISCTRLAISNAGGIFLRNWTYDKRFKSKDCYIKPRKAEFNKYTIRKINYTYYVFVNGMFAGEYPYMSLIGEVINIHAEHFNIKKLTPEIFIDYIKVSYLKI